MRGDEAVEDTLEADGTASFESEVEYADLPATFTFAVAEEQKDSLDNGEEIAADTVEHVHDGLSLAAAQDVAITASFATQTLIVRVYHEKDQVDGFTGNALGDDELMSGVLDVGVRQAASGNRTGAISSEDWDEDANATDEGGVLTFAHLPSAANIIVTANAAGQNVIIHGSDQLATYEDFDDNGLAQTSSVFGEQGGYHHTVELCPMQAEGGECASFGFIKTYTVDGQAWKYVREMDSDDGFKATNTTVGELGTTVSMAPVDDKNLEGEDAEPFTAEDADDKKFDFGRMADGVYAVGVPEGWMATAGKGGDELDDEFLLARTLTDDKDDDDANDHLNIDVTPTTGFLYGIVENQDGVRAEGVTVDVNDGEASDMTDEFGRYMVEGFSKQKSPNAAIVVTVSGAGYATQKFSTATTGSTKVPNFAANSPKEYDITVTGSGSATTFTGTVTAAGGGPLSGVQIGVTGSDLLNPNAKATGSTTDDIYETGDDGVYAVMVEANGADVTLSASMKNVSFAPDGYTQQATAGSFPGPNFIGFQYATISGRVVLMKDGQAAGGEEHVRILAFQGEVQKKAATTLSSGIFSLRVPHGTYTIKGEANSGYTLEFQNGRADMDVTVAPGQTFGFDDIEASVTGDRPPRFTSSAGITYKSDKNARDRKATIATVSAVDPDASTTGITFDVTKGSEDIEVENFTGRANKKTGRLFWVSGPPAYNAKDATANVRTVTLEATGDGAAKGEQVVTVTVTPSGDVVVKLNVAPNSISEGASSTVTATLNAAAENSFSVRLSTTDVTTAAKGGPNDRVVAFGPVTTLFFDEGATNSSGAPVMLTAKNDNRHTGEQKVEVWGTISPSDDDITVASDTLTITETDEPYAKVMLVLTPSSVDEAGDDGTTPDITENASTVTAVLGDGLIYPEDITITVTVPNTENDVTGVSATGTLIIPAGSRSSALLANGRAKPDDATGATHAIVPSGTDASDAGNTQVTVMGTATVVALSGRTVTPDYVVGGTSNDASLRDILQPDNKILVIRDDDTAPGAPRTLKATGSRTTDGLLQGDIVVTWSDPSQRGELNGVAAKAPEFAAGVPTETDGTPAAPRITYQVRHGINPEDFMDDGWAPVPLADGESWTVTVQTPADGTRASYTVQVRAVISDNVNGNDLPGSHESVLVTPSG